MREKNFSEDRAPIVSTRRAFLGGAIVLVAVPPVFSLSGCPAPDDVEPQDRPTEIDGWPIPKRTKLDAAHYATLVAAMDAILPDTDGTPGATQANAAWYLDQLLAAFDTDPPRVFAGGPYSGRHGGVDNFSHFQRLTRVEEIRWRTFIEGSQGIPEREWNGPVRSLHDRYVDGLDLLESAAQEQYGSRYTGMNPGDRLTLILALQNADPEPGSIDRRAFSQMLFEHTVEGTVGDPVYGGNEGFIGWQAISFEGDRQPVGYTVEQVSEPRE